MSDQVLSSARPTTIRALTEEGSQSYNKEHPSIRCQKVTATTHCGVSLQIWQGPALDALAAWLGEDSGRMEPRLRQQDAVQRFVSLFASYSQNADSEALARLLDPFLRIMKRSRKITVCLQPLLTPGLCMSW